MSYQVYTGNLNSPFTGEFTHRRIEQNIPGVRASALNDIEPGLYGTTKQVRERLVNNTPMQKPRFGDGYGRQRLEQFGGNFHRRMMTPGGWREAAGEMIDGVNDYTSRFGRSTLDPTTIEKLREGWTFGRDGAKITNAITGQAKLTKARNFGSKYAGNAIADAATKFKPLARAINVIPGLNLLGDIFDVGEAVVGVARKDKVRQREARQLAQQMAASGMSLDQALQTIEQGGGQLEALVGNQGLDDFGKTAAYAAFTGVPSLNPIAAVAGLVTAGDLQWEKYRRNQIFRNEFMKAQGR